MAFAGDPLVAVASVSNRVDGDGSTNSTTYTNVLTSSTVPGVVFFAPPTGKVTVLFSAATYCSTQAADMKTSVRVKTGSTIGSGTTVFGTSDADMDLWMILAHLPANFAERRHGYAEVTGLTPGSSYNVQMMCRAPDATSHWLYKHIKVIPDL